MNPIISENLRGFEIKFKTKPGVLSEKGLDKGTKLLIENLQVEDNTLVADLGSGSGVVGFVLAKLNSRGHVHFLDDHLRAVSLAQENLELNDLKNVEIYLSDLFSAVPNRTYHQIFSNPPQQLGNNFLEELIVESYKHLKSEGLLWLVVKQNLKTVIEKMLRKTFGTFEIIAQNKQYIILKGLKK